MARKKDKIGKSLQPTMKDINGKPIYKKELVELILSAHYSKNNKFTFEGMEYNFTFDKEKDLIKVVDYELE